MSKTEETAMGPAGSGSTTATSGTAPARTLPYAWYVAALLGLSYLVSIMDRYIVSVVQEDIRHDLMLTDTQLGFLQGPAFTFLFVLSSLPFGRLADTVNRVRLVFIGILLWSASTLACAFATNFQELLYARLGVGLGEAALLPCAMSLIPAYFSRDKLSRGISLYTMGGSFGRAAGFMGGGALFAFFTARQGLEIAGFGTFKPWHSVFLIAGFVGIVVAFIFLFTVREPPRVSTPGVKADFKSGLAYVWRRRLAFAAIFIPFSANSAIVAVLASWSVSFYVREFGTSAAMGSHLIGITGLIVAPLGHSFGGWLNDKLRSRGVKGAQPVVLGVLLVLMTVFGCAFTVAPTLAIGFVLYALSYFSATACGPTGFGGVQYVAPEQFRGLISSLFMLTYMFLSGTGPFIAGTVNDIFFSTNKGGQLGYAMAITLILLLALSLPFAIWGRKAFERASEENEATVAKQLAT